MARRSMIGRATRAGCAALALAWGGSYGTGCGDDSHDHDDGDGHGGELGPASGAECPNDSDLTYEGFGKAFMEDYCTRCHSSELTGNARMGAPPGHDFDTLNGIRVVSDHIDQLAAAGPDSVNVIMPLTNPKPSLEERKMLGEWLACDAPE